MRERSGAESSSRSRGRQSAVRTAQTTSRSMRRDNRETHQAISAMQTTTAASA